MGCDCCDAEGDVRKLYGRMLCKNCFYVGESVCKIALKKLDKEYVDSVLGIAKNQAIGDAADAVLREIEK